MTTIAEYFGDELSYERRASDCTVTIAQLAANTAFNPYAPQREADAPHCAAFDALLDHYADHEMSDGGVDFHDGFWMSFADGSELRYRTPL